MNKIYIELEPLELVDLKIILDTYKGRDILANRATQLLKKIRSQEGKDWMSLFTKEFGRRGGLVKSEAKAQAARETGKLFGGRRAANTQRDCEIYILVNKQGLKVRDVAKKFSLTTDAVYKILERQRPRK